MTMKEEPTDVTNGGEMTASGIGSCPADVVSHLLLIGVCARCISRLFGRSEQHDGVEQIKDSTTLCRVCLGILQFSYTQETTTGVVVINGEVSDFAAWIAEKVKGEGHEIDSFALEIAVPAIVSANERAIRLYMENKYGAEFWFKEMLPSDRVSFKDAFKLSIIKSLETFLDAKYGGSSFLISLTYTQTKDISGLSDSQGRDHNSKRRKTASLIETGPGDSLSSVGINGMGSPQHANGEAGLNGLHDNELLKSPLENVREPCCLTCHCYSTPIYIGGRYLKYSRNVSQTRWIIDDERKGEASVEEIIGNTMLPFCRGDNYKFHAAGREDIDVRMLGSGRPFLIEVQNARHDPSKLSMGEIEEKINNSEDKLVRVRNIKMVGIEGWNLMREGEAEKQKQYAALVWISRTLKDEDLQTISSYEDMKISQRTPIRVLHRRSPLDRERIIHWMKVERIVGSTQYFLLHLCTQAGTYIKEFVHGDLGRTQPSIGSILGCRAEILQLDVTDVKMDCFI